jgi:pilus assembly protein CpaF
MAWEINQQVFGPLYPYIIDDNVTDIDWDGSALWVSYAMGNTERLDVPGLDARFIANFTQFMANQSERPFNQIENTLSAETDMLRITAAHESLVASGRCLSIRKSMPKLRFTATSALADRYCPEDFMHFLVNCVKVHMNFAFCGEPGHGKTECAKFFSTFIRPEDNVITIEDTLEWHYKYINPGKRADEIRVNDSADYTKAIKLALRLNPTWLMLSEARSTEVKYLIEGWSTGVHGMTTLHTSDVRNIPDRIVTMSGNEAGEDSMANNVYSYLDLGILLEKTRDEDGTTHRRIMQAAVFERVGGENRCTIVMENGAFYKERVPGSFTKLLKHAGVVDPFYCPELAKRMEDESNGIYYGMGTPAADTPDDTQAYDIAQFGDNIADGEIYNDLRG